MDMTKQDQVAELKRRIRYNIEQRDYYKSREDDSENPAMWSELRSWYEGRVSAFNIAMMMIDPTQEEVQ